MRVRGWTWDASVGPAGLGNRPLLEALEVALPDVAVEEVIERTGTRERRRRLLPTHLVVVRNEPSGSTVSGGSTTLALVRPKKWAPRSTVRRSISYP